MLACLVHCSFVLSLVFLKNGNSVQVKVLSQSNWGFDIIFEEDSAHKGWVFNQGKKSSQAACK